MPKGTIQRMPILLRYNIFVSRASRLQGLPKYTDWLCHILQSRTTKQEEVPWQMKFHQERLHKLFDCVIFLSSCLLRGRTAQPILLRVWCKSVYRPAVCSVLQRCKQDFKRYNLCLLATRDQVSAHTLTATVCADKCLTEIAGITRAAHIGACSVRTAVCSALVSLHIVKSLSVFGIVGLHIYRSCKAWISIWIPAAFIKNRTA